MEKERPPENVAGRNPKELADEIVNSNFFYQKKLYEELIFRYQKEAEGDYQRPSLAKPEQKRIQLARGLERMAKGINNSLIRPINDICRTCKKYLHNPYENPRNL